jgi:AcrR family transcriptional regulator
LTLDVSSGNINDMRQAPYHHGDLRTAALERVAAVVAEMGPGAVTMRGVATDLGVTHTALGHAFGSRRGMLTALAVDGYRELGERMRGAGGGLLAIGLAYVRFGLERPGHFAVMFEPELLDGSDATLAQARAATRDGLRRAVEGMVGESREAAAATLAAWSLMHGLVHLERSGMVSGSGLADELGGDIVEIAETVARQLFRR